MLKMFKTAYCFYIVQLLLKFNTEQELNKFLDKLMKDNSFELRIQGDNDVKEAFKYVYDHRRYNLSLIQNKPEISNKIVMKILIKSII